MIGSIGPLLRQELAATQVPYAEQELALAVSASYGAATDWGGLPVFLQLEAIPQTVGEDWDHYCQRVGEPLSHLTDRLQKVGIEEPEMLFASNAISCSAAPGQVEDLVRDDSFEGRLLELDPLRQIVQMNDVPNEVELSKYRERNGEGDGDGVRIALIDSGADLRHPFLRIDESATVCGESDEIPGSHGTHCAGIIASTDGVFRGVAPGADLINIKALQANNFGTSTGVSRAIDEAIAQNVDLISISVGFNHLPRSVRGGHEWVCSDGRCILCTAIDNATAREILVVAAGGNEHESSQGLFLGGRAGEYDTELTCPGQARGAITVGAISKGTRQPATFSSCGPTSYGIGKPDLVAPGVSITSTVPVPRDSHGQPQSSPPRKQLFGPMSGTSMATPIVAGAVALILQHARERGEATDVASVRSKLLDMAVEEVPGPKNAVGAGNLCLGAI